MNLRFSAPAVLVGLCSLPVSVDFLRASDDWKPAGSPIVTRWTNDVSPENVHAEYPRPQLVRSEWLNLNGLWDYAIQPREESAPGNYQGRILVPFPVESSLSGVGRTVGPENRLWYRRIFSIPPEWHGKRIRLNFGASDWETAVWINGSKVGEHRGGLRGEGG